MICYAELCSFCFLEPNDSGACYTCTREIHACWMRLISRKGSCESYIKITNFNLNYCHIS